MVTKCMLKYIETDYNSRFQDKNYRKILIFASLLHDIGKTITTEKGEDGLYHCIDHATKGVPIARHILDTYTPDIEFEYKEAILSLVQCHMKPLYILRSKNPGLAIIKLANSLKYIDFESLLLLKQCDCEGSMPETNIQYKEILAQVQELYYKVCSYPTNTIVQITKIGEADSCPYKPNCHPNGINVGYTIIGNLSFPITVGFRVFLGLRFSTSPVTKIIDKNHFQTKNSVYSIIEY